MSERIPKNEAELDHLTPKQREFVDSALMDTDFQLSDYRIPTNETPEDFADTKPDKLAWKDPVSSIMDYQVDAAKEILEGAPAKPATPGKTDEFELPRIPVAADKKPELARPTETTAATEPRLDQKYSPLEVEKRRMQEREARKKKGFFARLFGG